MDRMRTVTPILDPIYREETKLMIVPNFVDNAINDILERKRQNIVKKKWELVELQHILAQLQEQSADNDTTGQQDGDTLR